MEASNADTRVVFDCAQQDDLEGLKEALRAADRREAPDDERVGQSLYTKIRHPFYAAAYVALWNGHLRCFRALAAKMGTWGTIHAANMCYRERGDALGPETLDAILAGCPSRGSWEMLNTALRHRSVRMVEAVLAVPQFNFRDMRLLEEQDAAAHYMLGGALDGDLAYLCETAPKVAMRLEAAGVWLGPCKAREAVLKRREAHGARRWGA